MKIRTNVPLRADLTLSHRLRDLTPQEERGEEILENSRLEKTAGAYYQGFP